MGFAHSRAMDFLCKSYMLAGVIAVPGFLNTFLARSIEKLLSCMTRRVSGPCGPTLEGEPKRRWRKP
jgi:hypothetical protein